MKNIGFKLKEIRENKKLSRREVAERLQSYGIEVSDKTLYGYEVGRTSANADMFLALCEIYGVENILETFKEESYQSSTLALNVDEIEIINQYRKLDKNGKDAVKNTLKFEVQRTPSGIVTRLKKYNNLFREVDYEGKHNEEENQ